MSWLEELVAGAREDCPAAARRRSRSRPCAPRLGTRDGARPFNEALVRPGLSLIAEFKRRSPSAGEIRPGARRRGDGQGVRARRRRRPLDPDRGAPLRRLARRPARGARGVGPARSCARTSSSTVPALRGGGERRRRRAADRRGARRPATSRSSTRRRGLDLDCLVEVHDEADLERALVIDADVIGINNRNLDDFSVDVETTVELLTDVPAGQDGGLGVRLRAAASSSTSSSGSASTRC